MPKGFLLLLLHAHLPYVRHPEYDYFLEENWLYEAAVETYIPLLDMFERLLNDRVDFRITLSLSPTLLEMFSDRLLNERLLRHINKLIELTAKELRRNRRNASLKPLCMMYHKRFKRIKRLYENRYGKDLVKAFKALKSTEQIEIITTSATHAYLPNLAPYPEAVNAQIKVGIENYKKHFGEAPAGLWLPECGYYEGLDRIVSEADIRFFFLETHGILHGRPKAKYGVFKPVKCPSGVVAFGRDAVSAKQVWCSKTGYPGDPDYRDFYRDIGYDLPLDYIRPYIHPDGIRIHTGIKYHRITGRTDRKKPYQRERALKKAKMHALDFIAKIKLRAEELNRQYNFTPFVVAPYDAELFGHWWFEGVEWLEFLLREISLQNEIKTVAPSECLYENPGLQTVSPSFSSWGNHGYSSTWVNKSNDWAIKHIHKACELMTELKERFPAPSPLIKRALNQAMRELLLSQSSDWQFLMHTGASAEYAEKRLTEHLKAFNTLYRMITTEQISEKWLAELEDKYCLFPELDYRV